MTQNNDNNCRDAFAGGHSEAQTGASHTRSVWRVVRSVRCSAQHVTLFQVVLCALVAVAASAAVREKRGYSSGWSGSLGGYSGGLSGGYSGGLSGGYSGGYSAPAAQVVAVNKVVNVQREVTVPQVVNVRKIVSVPQVVTVKQVVPVSGGYGGSLGGGYSSGSIGYSSGYSSGGYSSGGHGGSGWW
nr:shematrin-like protein 3 [Helicoverpa armigera]